MTTTLPVAVAVLAGLSLSGVFAYRWRQSHRLRLQGVGLCRRIARVLTTAERPEHVIEHLFQTVVEHTGAVAGVLCYRAYADEALTVLAVTGIPEEVLAKGQWLDPDAQGWQCGSVRVSGKLELVQDGLRRGLAECAGMALDGRQNMICIPVVRSGGSRGLLQLVSGPERPYTRQQLLELEGVGLHLGAAVYNALLSDAIRRRREAAEELFEISQRICTLHDLDQILRHAVEQAFRLMDADLVWYFGCPDSGGRTAQLRNVAGELPDGFVEGDEYELGVGVVELMQTRRTGVDGKAFLSLPSLLGEDAFSLLDDPVLNDRFLRSGIRSALLVRVGGGGKARGLLCSFSRHPQAYGESEVDLLCLFADQMSMGLNNAEMHASRRDMLVMAERQRLSNDLHDNMSQVINGLSLELHSLAKLADRGGNGAPLVQRVRNIDNRLDDAKAAIRGAIFELQLPEGESLWENLREFSERFENWHGLVVDTDVPDEMLDLPLDRQREVLRIVQEALWNTRKHSGARSARLTGSHVDGTVRLVVSDAGRGADGERLGRGQGISTMRHRAERLDGMLAVERNPPDGLRVALEFPADARN